MNEIEHVRHTGRSKHLGGVIGRNNSQVGDISCSARRICFDMMGAEFHE